VHAFKRQHGLTPLQYRVKNEQSFSEDGSALDSRTNE
jgi:AraC-like DNA-binding protein